MSVIQMKSPSFIVFEIFAKMAFLTSDLGPRSKVMAPNETLYMISYMSIIQMKSLSLVVFEIFAKMAFLTSDLGPRSKVMAANESPYMIFNMSVIQMKSLSLIFVKIAFLTLDLGQGQRSWHQMKAHICFPLCL